MGTERCISVTQQPLPSELTPTSQQYFSLRTNQPTPTSQTNSLQDPTQATTLETPSLMAPVSRVLFLAVIVVVAVAVLPPSPVQGEDNDSMYCKYTYAYHPIVFLTDILDIYMTNH
jgi:hypothetical protein